MATDPPPSSTDGPRPLLARVVVDPIQAFLRIEAAGGILLVAAAVVAVAWASSPWGHGHDRLFEHHLPGARFPHSPAAWIDDGAMALFFFVVGLEIKREWVAGALRDRRAAAVPALAALGGMVVPALVFVACTHGRSGGHGWGIAMATDIAFALGVLSLLGSRVPPSLKVFLLTLAIVDDVGAIVVIAAVYSDGIAWGWLAAAAGIVGLVLVLRRLDVRAHVAYLAVGALLWFATFQSGVHATIAGVVLALLTPAVARPGESEPLGERLEHALHPWTSFVIVPVFALANAAIDVGGPGFTDPDAVSLGVLLGLVVGKVVGISLGTLGAIKGGLGPMPEGASTLQLLGVAALGGIGFTVSIFVAGLAYRTGLHGEEARAAILVSSVLAAALGSTILVLAARRTPVAPDPA